MKLVKLKSFTVESKERLLQIKAGELPLAWPAMHELQEKLGMDLREILDNKVRFSVKVGKRYKMLRGKLRSELYHCQCGSCSPEIMYYMIPAGNSAVGQSAI